MPVRGSSFALPIHPLCNFWVQISLPVQAPVPGGRGGGRKGGNLPGMLTKGLSGGLSNLTVLLTPLSLVSMLGPVTPFLVTTARSLKRARSPRPELDTYYEA